MEQITGKYRVGERAGEEFTLEVGKTYNMHTEWERGGVRTVKDIAGATVARLLPYGENLTEDEVSKFYSLRLRLAYGKALVTGKPEVVRVFMYTKGSTTPIILPINEGRLPKGMTYIEEVERRAE